MSQPVDTVTGVPGRFRAATHNTDWSTDAVEGWALVTQVAERIEDRWAATTGEPAGSRDRVAVDVVGSGVAALSLVSDETKGWVS